jgi:hypothetical protein
MSPFTIKKSFTIPTQKSVELFIQPFQTKRRKIMNKIDLVKSATGFDDMDKNAMYLSDDFQFTDSIGGPPYDKAGWIEMGKLLQHSFPDIEEAIDDIREEGDSVILISHFEGTFTNDLDLSAAGMGVIPASGKMVMFPSSTIKISFDGDQVSRIHNTDTGPEAGLPGLLKALGVTVSQ